MLHASDLFGVSGSSEAASSNASASTTSTTYLPTGGAPPMEYLPNALNPALCTMVSMTPPSMVKGKKSGGDASMMLPTVVNANPMLCSTLQEEHIHLQQQMCVVMAENQRLREQLFRLSIYVGQVVQYQHHHGILADVPPFEGTMGSAGIAASPPPQPPCFPQVGACTQPHGPADGEGPPPTLDDGQRTHASMTDADVPAKGVLGWDDERSRMPSPTSSSSGASHPIPTNTNLKNTSGGGTMSGSSCTYPSASSSSTPAANTTPQASSTSAASTRGFQLYWALKDCHDGAIPRALFSPNGNLIASASVDRTVKVWSLMEKNLVWCSREARMPLTDLAWCPHSQYIVAASLDGRYAWLDVEAQAVSVVHEGGGLSLCVEMLAGQSTNFLCSTIRQQVLMVDTRQKGTSRAAGAVDVPYVVNSIVGVPNGWCFMTGDTAGAVRIYDLRCFESKGPIHTELPNSISASSARSGVPTLTSPPPTTGMNVGSSGGGTSTSSSSSSSSKDAKSSAANVGMLPTATNERLGGVPAAAAAPLGDVCLTPEVGVGITHLHLMKESALGTQGNARYLLTSGQDSVIRLFDRGSFDGESLAHFHRYELRRTFTGHRIRKAPIRISSWSPRPDSGTSGSSGSNGSGGSGGGGSGAALSSVGRPLHQSCLVATGSLDGTVYVYEMHGVHEQHRENGDEDALLRTGDSGGTARRSAIRSNQGISTTPSYGHDADLLQRLEGAHTDIVYGTHFHSLEPMLLSHSADASIRIWVPKRNK